MMSNDNDRKFVLYRASAGSGKTYTLVREFLAICLDSSDNSYREILAVTFTNKAANEMKNKILITLDDIINLPVEKCSVKNELLQLTNLQENVLVERAKLLYNNILHNYSDFNVSTIDSFVQHISRSFARELNLPAQYMVLLDDDDLMDELIQRIDEKIGKEDSYLTEILEDFVEYQLDKESSWKVEFPIRDFVAKLLKESAYKKGESLNLTSLSKDEYLQTLNYLNEKIDSFKLDINDTIENLNEIINAYSLTDDCFYQGSKGLPSLLRKKIYFDKLDELDPSSFASAYVKKIFDGSNWFSSKAPKDLIFNVNKSVNIVDLFRKIVTDYNNLYITNLIRKNLYLYVLRTKLLEIIDQYIEETNKVHISEFNKRISDVIGDCSVPFIYERIGNRFKHFFIDEFQDTSLLQWFNFMPLINNSLSENKKSILVGDAKQAIYRFRSGEVEQIIQLPRIYKKTSNELGEDCETNFINNWEAKSLGTNYRSKKHIVEFNNSFFDYSKDYLDDEDYKKVYQDNMKQKVRDNLLYDGCVRVEVFKMDNFKDLSNENAKKESEKTLYKNAVKNSMLEQIKVLIDKGFQYKDITILVRSNADGSDIAGFLANNNIPIVSADSILLKSSDKVMLMVLTLKYLSDENNAVTKLSLSYYNQLCKSSSDENNDFSNVVASEIDVEGLMEIRNNAYSLYDLCVKLIRFYNFNIIEDIFLQYFMNLVYEWQNSDNNGITSFIEHWDRKSHNFFVKLSADIDAVSIMSVHKSKGLEFKVVMYPYAYTKVPSRFQSDEIWLSVKENIDVLNDIPHIDKFLLPINKKILGTDLSHYYTDEYNKAAFDDFNIMYVAMTRPEDILFVYTNDDHDKKSKTDRVNNFFLDYFKDNCCHLEENDENIVYQIGNIEYHESKESKAKPVYVELSEDDDIQTLNWMESLRLEADPTMFWSDDEEFSPQEWGNLVHEIFSKINTIDDAHNVIDNYLNEGSIDEKQASSLYEKFKKIISKEEIKEAYSANAIVRNEMEIMTPAARLRPDRYVELDDKVIIIDYKTGREDALYYEQLKEYMIALRQMNFEKDIEAYLVYLKDDVEVQRVFLDRLF